MNDLGIVVGLGVTQRKSTASSAGMMSDDGRLLIAVLVCVAAGLRARGWTMSGRPGWRTRPRPPARSRGSSFPRAAQRGSTNMKEE